MERIFIEGLLLQASLIFALGAQNMFVLESGLTKQHPILVSFICYFCDLVLIMLGVAGAATLFTSFPEIKIVVGVIGVAFLMYYGMGKLRMREGELNLDCKKCINLKDCIMKAITFSLINPHAYLDGVVLIGGYSAKYSVLQERLVLGLGASTFSLIWFLVLSGASSTMIPLFKNPRRMRYFMCTAGVFLIFLSAKLSLDVYSWVQEIKDPGLSLALQSLEGNPHH